jgi:tetratricopeptide (TPR) repeat protein
LAAAILTALGCKTYITTANYNSFETLWRSILAYDPDHPHWNALSGMSDVLHKRAVELEKQGRHAEALELNEEARAYDERALAVRPGYALAHYGLAVYHRFRGDAAQALAEAAKAIELDPNDARFYALQAHAYESAHQSGKALEAAGRAVALNSRRVPYHLAYAQLLMDAGQEDRARQEIADALTLDARSAEAHVLLGVLGARNDNMSEALREFEEAVRDDPSNLEAQDSLARLVAILPNSNAARLRDALAMAQHTVSASHRATPAYLDTLAMVWHRMGKDKEALAALTEALNSKDPIDETVRSNILRHRAAWTQPDAAPAATR